MDHNHFPSAGSLVAIMPQLAFYTQDLMVQLGCNARIAEDAVGITLLVLGVFLHVQFKKGMKDGKETFTAEPLSSTGT